MSTTSRPNTSVDDSDTNAIQYLDPSPPPANGHAWFTNSSGSLLGAVFKSTLTGCGASGASIVFRFDGSNVYAFGSVVDSNGNSPPVSVYSVDGDSPTVFTAPQVTGRRDAVQFFASGALPLGNHTLTINITNASPAAPYYLDYFQYSTDVLPLPSSSSHGLAASASQTESPSETSQSPSASTSSMAEEKPTAPTGAIVGGVVGGLAVLFILIGALYWRHNKRPSGQYNYGTKAHQDVPPTITPYVPPTPTPSLHGGTRSPFLNLSPGGSTGVSGRSDGGDTTSEVLSSGIGSSTPSQVNPTPPGRPAEGAPAAHLTRRLTEMSYMRPPSTLPEGFPHHGTATLSDPGGGEDLPAYTPS